MASSPRPQRVDDLRRRLADLSAEILKTEDELASLETEGRLALGENRLPPKISPSLVSLHVKLLRLAPEIQGFLRDLTSPKALQHFSLRKLAALAELSHDRQLVEFASLRSQFK